MVRILLFALVAIALVSSTMWSSSAASPATTISGKGFTNGWRLLEVDATGAELGLYLRNGLGSPSAFGYAIYNRTGDLMDLGWTASPGDDGLHFHVIGTDLIDLSTSAGGLYHAKPRTVPLHGDGPYRVLFFVAGETFGWNYSLHAQGLSLLSSREGSSSHHFTSRDFDGVAAAGASENPMVVRVHHEGSLVVDVEHTLFGFAFEGVNFDRNVSSRTAGNVDPESLRLVHADGRVDECDCRFDRNPHGPGRYVFELDGFSAGNPGSEEIAVVVVDAPIWQVQK
ncbi:MAG TPA: hypothetical protein VM889_04925 [Candidatus Thermoplasmatota archaeon]|nr:hypothetical protein [Candidatus Thermoplasmatota archaeon]